MKVGDYFRKHRANVNQINTPQEKARKFRAVDRGLLEGRGKKRAKPQAPWEKR